jgi:hypothetical protein
MNRDQGLRGSICVLIRAYPPRLWNKLAGRSTDRISGAASLPVGQTGSIGRTRFTRSLC